MKTGVATTDPDHKGSDRPSNRQLGSKNYDTCRHESSLNTAQFCKRLRVQAQYLHILGIMSIQYHASLSKIVKLWEEQYKHLYQMKTPKCRQQLRRISRKGLDYGRCGTSLTGYAAQAGAWSAAAGRGLQLAINWDGWDIGSKAIV